MSLELDHVFVCPPEERAAINALAEFGLQFARQGVHPGQGTANVCAFFDNAYLELLWRRDDAELQSNLVRPVSLWERVRWPESGACPFGLAFRTTGADVPLTAETWRYEAPFLPTGAFIPIVTPRHAAGEPLLFISTVSSAPVSWPPERRPPLEHRGRHRNLTALVLSQPATRPLSPAPAVLVEMGLFAVKDEREYHLEIEWDGGSAGESHDFRPVLPLSLRW